MNIEMMREKFENILSLEEKAKSFYEHYIERVSDEKIKSRLVEIYNDEIKHVAIAKKLIELAS